MGRIIEGFWNCKYCGSIRNSDNPDYFSVKKARENARKKQQKNTDNENDWYLPEGARLQNSRTEIYTYQQVLDHYETRSKQVAKERITGYEKYVTGYKDLGNGYFEQIASFIIQIQ